MIRIENNCVCCDLPCIDCGRRHEEVLYCDCCNHSFEKCYNYNGRDLCENCFFETVFKETLVEELIDLINYLYQSNIYKIEDSRFYIGDLDGENFEEFSEEIFLSYLEDDLNGFSIEKIINYLGNVNIITLD